MFSSHVLCPDCINENIQTFAAFFSYKILLIMNGTKSFLDKYNPKFLNHRFFNKKNISLLNFDNLLFCFQNTKSERIFLQTTFLKKIIYDTNQDTSVCILNVFSCWKNNLKSEESERNRNCGVNCSRKFTLLRQYVFMLFLPLQSEIIIKKILW